jgi:D-proline reductase (dithiol) PrdB
LIAAAVCASLYADDEATTGMRREQRMSYVRYIDKTRDYYLKEGYEKPYDWAHFDDVPFTPLEKPLSECRATLVSTCDIAIRDDGTAHTQEMLVGNAYVIPSDTPVERLYSQQEHFDKHATHVDDVDSYFPISRLREAVAAGRLGSVAARLHGVHMSYSKRHTLEADGPLVLERCREDGVDVAIMTPI